MNSLRDGSSRIVFPFQGVFLLCFEVNGTVRANYQDLDRPAFALWIVMIVVVVLLGGCERYPPFQSPAGGWLFAVGDVTTHEATVWVKASQSIPFIKSHNPDA